MNLILILVLLGLLVLGLPVAVVLILFSIFPNIINPLFPADPVYIIRALVNGVNSFPILAVPMFMLSGTIMAKGKLSAKIFDFFSYFVSGFTGGIPIAVITTCLFYGAISGSGPATTSAVGAMTVPLLIKLGYDEDFSLALVAVAGGLGVVIPPSIPFIFFGQAAGVSVADLFIAGIIPGLLIGFSMMIYVFTYLKKNGEDSEKIKIYRSELKQRGFWNIFKESFLAILCPVIILGSIYSGIASPTEAAVISVYYSLIVSVFVYKSIKVKDLKEILIETINSYASILIIIAAAAAFARVLVFLNIPSLISSILATNISSKFVLLIVINLILLVVGMVMDTTPAILVLTPIIIPLAMKFGIEPIHLGIITVVNLAIGFVTPPLGVNLFVASSLSDIPVDRIIRKSLPFIGIFIICLLLITFIPSISLILIWGYYEQKIYNTTYNKPNILCLSI